MRILSATFVFVFSGYVSPCIIQAQQTDFRGTSWGMTREEVTKLEGRVPYLDIKRENNRSVIGFAGEFDNLKCAYLYTFDDNRKLEQCSYLFIEKHPDNPTKYIEDFRAVKNSITANYGPPATDQPIWLNTQYKDNQSSWIKAIQLSHLIYIVKWNHNDNTVVQSLMGNGSDITHIVIFAKKKAEANDKGLP